MLKISPGRPPNRRLLTNETSHLRESLWLVALVPLVFVGLGENRPEDYVASVFFESSFLDQNSLPCLPRP